MVQSIAWILLILNPRHQKGQDRKEEEIPEADTKNGIRLEPLPIRRPMEMIDPYKTPKNSKSTT